MANSQVLTEPVIGKLSASCDKKCIEVKQDTLCKVTELEERIENQEMEENKRVNGLEIASEGFTIFAKFATDFDQQTFVPDVHKNRLVKRIDKAHKEGHLTDEQSEEMKKQVQSAAGFDPTRDKKG